MYCNVSCSPAVVYNALPVHISEYNLPLAGDVIDLSRLSVSEDILRSEYLKFSLSWEM